jgi:hypothetical protein
MQTNLVRVGDCGASFDRPRPTRKPFYVADDMAEPLPFEPDPQHSGRHGSERGPQPLVDDLTTGTRAVGWLALASLVGFVLAVVGGVAWLARK